MIKRLAPLAVLVLSVACSSVPMNSSSNTGFASTGVATNKLDATSYILLDSPNQIRPVDWSSTVYPLHVYGTLTNKGFIPAGGIEGKGKLCADGKDFLSLVDLKVYKAADGKTPVAPYIAGCATTNGFQPSSRDVVLQ
ncbi:MAG: hypothetical protein JWO56_2748 [Acidobacteria bacterium]|nr:hypothetical protein [Acidobacteriota bacterium]